MTCAAVDRETVEELIALKERCEKVERERDEARAQLAADAGPLPEPEEGD